MERGVTVQYGEVSRPESKREEGRGKREEGRGKREEGRGKREEGQERRTIEKENGRPASSAMNANRERATDAAQFQQHSVRMWRAIAKRQTFSSVSFAAFNFLLVALGIVALQR
jgi:hypothetical protein